MSLLEKYLEGKERLHKEFEEITKKCDEALDMAGGKFLQEFKEMIAEASDEEFHDFMCKSGDELDTVERMAALTARLESYGKRTKDEDECETDGPHECEHKNESKNDNDGPHVVIIGLG